MPNFTNFRRSWYILTLFGGILLEIGWLKLQRRFKNEQAVKAKTQALYRRQAVRFRETALKMQGLLIKLGQFFSTRVDVLPEEYIQELALLQDEVPGLPFADIRAVIEDELGKPVEQIFDALDQVPLAAASLGQVHKGVIKGGIEVAIKVLRPGIDRIMEVDLKAFRGVILMLKLFTDWNKSMDLDALFNDFAATLREELDYGLELGNTERFRANFANDSKIRIPLVYADYSSRRVLTMEYVTGIKVTDYEGLRRAGVNPTILAQNLINAYLKQVLVDGFYHADPHPGNLFIGHDGVITFIDFGMVGRLTESNKQAIRKMVSSIIASDATLMAEALVDMGVINSQANMISLRRGINAVMEQLRGLNFDRIGEFQFDTVLEQLREFVYNEPFQFPANFSFLGRAIGTLVGLASGLDPTLNILEVIRPYSKYVLGEDEQTVSDIAWKKSKEIGMSLINLPSALEKTLRQAQNGDLQFKSDQGYLSRTFLFQEILVNRILWAFLLAFSCGIAAYFWVNGFVLEATRTLYVSGILTFILVLNLRKRSDKIARGQISHHRLK